MIVCVYVQGYRQKNTYIATQGPLESTVCDFWRMVWEKESKCVVLLSKLNQQGEVDTWFKKSVPSLLKI